MDAKRPYTTNLFTIDYRIALTTWTIVIVGNEDDLGGSI